MLETLKRLQQLVVEDVVRLFVVWIFLPFLHLGVFCRRRCCFSLVAWIGDEQGRRGCVGPVATGCGVNVGGRAPYKDVGVCWWWNLSR